YIAGAERQTVYLSHPRLVDHVLTVNVNTGDTAYIRINLPSIDYHSLRLKVVPPVYYLLDGMGQTTYSGLVGTWDATNYLDITWYMSAVPIENGDLVLLTMLNQKNILAKLRHQKSQLDFYPNLLTLQGGDGIFSTHGTLLY